MTNQQPRPRATEYWRYGDVLVRVTSVRRFDIEKGWSVKPPDVGEDWVAFRRANAKPGEGESEIPVWEFRRDAKLVFSNRQEDEVLDRLSEHEKNLRELKSLAHSIAVVGSGLEGEAVRVLRDAAEALEVSAEATWRTLLTARRIIQRDRTHKHSVALRALNDELGIPNCDHLVPDPDCPECTKDTIST